MRNALRSVFKRLRLLTIRLNTRVRRSSKNVVGHSWIIGDLGSPEG